VRDLLPGLRKRHDLSFVVCNGENAAAGFGLTREAANELFQAGVDVLTGGNHLWDRKESHSYLAEEPRLVRPANLPPGTPGLGQRVFEAADGTRVGVVNLLGRVFMKEADCPFRAADQAVAALAPSARVILVDFHAETTAEKMAMGWYLDGRVSFVVGTHTHIPTADERILPQGTAYLTDAGMTGSFDSVIGMDRGVAIRRFLTLMPERFTPADGNLWLNAVLVTVDPATGHAQKITPLRIPHAAPEKAAPKILLGDPAAAALRARAHTEVVRLRAAGTLPTLALVSVGEDPASRIYLQRKQQACAEIGIEARRVTLAAGVDTRAVVAEVEKLARDRDVHGILVQLPLAPPADAQAVMDALPPEKDVDGFHPVNAGRLALGLPGLVPCTPRGILELLRYYAIPVAGAHVVVLGRSSIVGRPLATLLSNRGVDATVTIGHSASGPKLQELARQADILIAAIGRPEMVTGDWIRPGATVVDVGIHRVDAPGTPKGSRITGDVHFESASRVAGAISPVPGGVGPMTVAMVVSNLVVAATRQSGVLPATVR